MHWKVLVTGFKNCQSCMYKSIIGLKVQKHFQKNKRDCCQVLTYMWLLLISRMHLTLLIEIYYGICLELIQGKAMDILKTMYAYFNACVTYNSH